MDKENNSTGNKKENIHENHRQRMRESFFEHGFDGMDDHEILEMLLYFSLPRRNTNEIAHSLINHFGSFSEVLEAERGELVKQPFITDNTVFLLKMILPIYKRYKESAAGRNRKFKSTDEIAEYLMSKFVDTNNECVYAMFFDADMNMIKCSKISEGDISSSMFDFRRLVSLVLETKSTSVIISHNHPHGITLPSREDVIVTENAFYLLKSLKVNLLDHIIVSETTYTSMISVPKFSHIFYGLNAVFTDNN